MSKIEIAGRSLTSIEIRDLLAAEPTVRRETLSAALLPFWRSAIVPSSTA
jgi:hypothetical protein